MEERRAAARAGARYALAGQSVEDSRAVLSRELAELSMAAEVTYASLLEALPEMLQTQAAKDHLREEVVGITAQKLTLSISRHLRKVAT